MPHYQNKAVELTPPPAVKEGEKVFVIRFTGEVFTDYSEYIDKFEFYQQRVFQCSLTKKKGLTFEEALTSEHAIKQKSHDVQDCYLRVICEQTHCSELPVGKLTSNIGQTLQSDLLVGEQLYTGGKKRENVRITEVKKGNKAMAQVLDEAGKPALGVLDGKPIIKSYARSAFLKKKAPAMTTAVIRDLISDISTRESYLGAPFMVKEKYLKRFGLKTKLSKEALEKKQKYEEKQENRKKEEKDAEKEANKRQKVDDTNQYPVEDLDLKEATAHPPPEAHETFDPMPLCSVDATLTTWGFLNSFASSKLLRLYPFALDDYINALESDKGSALLSHIFASLLRLLVATHKEYGINQAAIAIRNWQTILTNVLSKDRDEFKYPRTVRTIRNRGYSIISFEEKMLVMEHIVKKLENTEPVAKQILDNIEEQKELAREKRATQAKGKKKKPQKKSEGGDEAGSDSEESSESEELDPAKKAEKIAKLERKMAELRIRFEPLGRDRFLNTYWWFGEQNYRDRFDIPTEMNVTPSAASRVYIQRHIPNIRESKKWRHTVEPAEGDQSLSEESDAGSEVEPSEISNNDECEACKGEGELLCCSGCPRAYHMDCLKPPLHRVPRGDWFCPVCSKTRRQTRSQYRDMEGLYSDDEASDEPGSSDYEDEGKEEEGPRKLAFGEIDSNECHVCKEKDSPFAKLLTCSDCPRAYHLGCCDPPLHHYPRRAWVCGRCDESIESHEEVCRGCKTSGTKKLLCCDSCPATWHLACLTPPLLRTPPGDWYCPDCANKEPESESEGQKSEGDVEGEGQSEGAKSSEGQSEGQNDGQSEGQKSKGDVETKESEQEVMEVESGEKEENEEKEEQEDEEKEEKEEDGEEEEEEPKSKSKPKGKAKGRKSVGKAKGKAKGGAKKAKKEVEDSSEDIDEEEVEKDKNQEEEDARLAQFREDKEEYEALMKERVEEAESEEERKREFIGDMYDNRVVERRYHSYWAYYETPEEIQALINWLDKRGNRESQLRKALSAKLPLLRTLSDARASELKAKALEEQDTSRRSTRLRQFANADKKTGAYLYYVNKYVK